MPLQLKSRSVSLNLSERHLCDLELLLNGGFLPLDNFMNRTTYESVLDQMRLSDGTLWPIPIVLDIKEETKGKLESEDCRTLALCDAEGVILAYLEVEEVWEPNKVIEAEKVFGTLDRTHPGVDYLFNKSGRYYVSGTLIPIRSPNHYDFTHLRKSPAELKSYFKEKGIDRVVGFQTRNPIHRAHLELTLRAAKQTGAHLLLHPAVGLTKPGDVDYFTRVKCYQKLLPYYPVGSVTLSLLPIAMRMAGPKEALWHAIIRRNYGCTHFIVGRDHAGPGKDQKGGDFYPPFAAQEMVAAYADEIGIEMIPFKEMVYVLEDDAYQTQDEVAPKKTVLNISGTELRKMLRLGEPIPKWFTYPEVEMELKKVYPPRSDQGFTLFFTGLSASGKSTIANLLLVRLAEEQHRPITLLDGDIIRKNLSIELGFSKEHRSLNVRRVGFVANEITKNRGIAICALIAPYEEDRIYNRNLISGSGNYIEVYLSTSFEECEKRDPKGLYSLAREGKLKGFTGLDDPYEVPRNPEISIDTSRETPIQAVELILNYLRRALLTRYANS